MEDTHHDLLVCYQFTDLGRELLNSMSDICHPTLAVLLYGDPTLTLEHNKKIFLAVLEFILKTKRSE